MIKNSSISRLMLGNCIVQVYSFVLTFELCLKMQNIQKSGIYNHDQKLIYFNPCAWHFCAGVVLY